MLTTGPSSTNARDSARVSQTRVFRVHLEDDLMDDTRLIVEVENKSLFMTQKNCMLRTYKAKEKAWAAGIDHLIIHRSDKRINTYSIRHHKRYTCSYTK